MFFVVAPYYFRVVYLLLLWGNYDFFLAVFFLLPAFSLLSLSSFLWGVCRGLCLALEAFLKYLASTDYLYLEAFKGLVGSSGLYPVGRVYSLFSLFIFKSNFWNMAMITVLVPDLWQVFSVGWWNPSTFPTLSLLSGPKLSLWPPWWQGHSSGHGPKWRSPGGFQGKLCFPDKSGR